MWTWGPEFHPMLEARCGCMHAFVIPVETGRYLGPVFSQPGLITSSRFQWETQKTRNKNLRWTGPDGQYVQAAPAGEGKDCLSEDAVFSWAESGLHPQSLPTKLPCYFFLRMGLCCHRPRERPLPGPQLCPLLAAEQACAWWAHLKSECDVLGVCLPPCSSNPSHLPRLSLEASRELPDWHHSSNFRCIKCCIDHPCNAWHGFLRCP